MIITSWVDKYRVNRYQKSNNCFIKWQFRNELVHKNTPSNQNIWFKANLIRISLIYIWILDRYDTLIVYLSSKIAQWSVCLIKKGDVRFWSIKKADFFNHLIIVIDDLFASSWKKLYFVLFFFKSLIYLFLIGTIYFADWIVFYISGYAIKCCI
jgi:hypothetical protein